MSGVRGEALVLVEVFIFRTIRARPAGAIRCWRSATSTACIAATGRSWTASAASRTSAAPRPTVMTFDPHPPRVVRPDKAPPLLMTTAQRLEAIAGSGVQGAAIVRFTHEMSQWDPETFVRSVLVDWMRVGEVWVGANFLFGHDRAGNFSMLRGAGRALRVQGREDRSGPLQGLRGQQHRGSGAWWARGVSTKPAPSSGISTTSTGRWCTAIIAARRSGFRPRISAPRTSSSRHMASTRRRRRSPAW